MIYQPKEDSYLLEKEVIKYSRGKKVLDMGSGSGIQARAALDSGAKEVIALDIDDESVKELKKKGIKKNFDNWVNKKSKFSNKTICKKSKMIKQIVYKAIKSDLFDKVKGKFDLIIFNPPYLPYDDKEDLKSRRATSGGKKGDEIILRFLNDANKFLEKDGIVLIVVSSLTPKNKINKILKEKRLEKKVISEEKLFFEKLEVWKVERKV